MIFWVPSQVVLGCLFCEWVYPVYLCLAVFQVPVVLQFVVFLFLSIQFPEIHTMDL